jgi:hypothetical protein
MNGYTESQEVIEGRRQRIAAGTFGQPITSAKPMSEQELQELVDYLNSLLENLDHRLTLLENELVEEDVAIEAIRAQIASVE